ncbi:MAG TPA: phosphonate ABC transporter, permease protein PhnE [Burkholderiales bacterium]|nr:phosphonate ABC transporter, permease protein PhnE [Burkholderiales bacterium]
MSARRFVFGRPRDRRTVTATLLLATAIVGVLGWSAHALGLSVTELARGLPWIGDLLSRMLPPNWGMLSRLWKPALETIQIAVWGTLFAVILAVPVAWLGAANMAPNRALFHLSRQVFNLARGINELIFALVFVAAVGLGPYAGILALTVHGAGSLAKFFAEHIEEADPGPIEALRATGADGLQTLVFGVLPQVLPGWVAATLYRLEVNLRTSTILGMVGAGGIGFELISSLKLFQYQDTATCVVVILVLVMGADWLSSKLRARILA